MKFKLITTLLACTALATTAHAAQPKKNLNADDRAKIAAMKKIVDSGLLFKDGIAKFATPDLAKAINGNIPGPKDDGYGWTCSYQGQFSGIDYTDLELKQLFKNAKYVVLDNNSVKVEIKSGIIKNTEYKFIKTGKNKFLLDDVTSLGETGRFSYKQLLKDNIKQGCLDS